GGPGGDGPHSICTGEISAGKCGKSRRTSAATSDDVIIAMATEGSWRNATRGGLAERGCRCGYCDLPIRARVGAIARCGPGCAATARRAAGFARMNNPGQY